MNDATYLAVQEESLAEARNLLLTGRAATIEAAMDAGDKAVGEAMAAAGYIWAAESRLAGLPL